jgi:hypothetical protein
MPAELCNFRVIKPRMLCCARNTAHMEQKRNEYESLVRKPKRKKPLEVLGIDERIILEWILGK